VQGVTDVFHTAAEVLQQGQGVCQDMAHVFLAAAAHAAFRRVTSAATC